MENNKKETFCMDCNHKKQVAVFSIACGNAEAIEERGTCFPDARNCPFWQEETKTKDEKKFEFIMNKINEDD